MHSLTALANKHGSDKGTIGPSQDWPAHNYTDIYEAYLWPLHSRPVDLLEVGLGVPGDSWRADIARGRNREGGASLKMWYDFFPQARIFGLDINPAEHLNNDRIATYVVDQGDRDDLCAFVQSVGIEFDVIIDDGSHRPDHQQVTLSTLFSHLKPGGLYFIEDLMRNGAGDGNASRYAAGDVLNTRRVLKHFCETGQFAGPNRLFDPEKLAAQIESVHFHVPQVRTELKVESPAAWRRQSRALRRVTRFRDDSEAMCVLQKRP